MSPDRSRVNLPALKEEDKRSGAKKSLRRGQETRAKVSKQGQLESDNTTLLGSLITARRDKSDNGAAAPPGISPSLYQEMKKFMTWIYDPIGLGAHIDYAIWQNDKVKLAKLAKLYKKIAQIFNFPT